MIGGFADTSAAYTNAFSSRQNHIDQADYAQLIKNTSHLIAQAKAFANKGGLTDPLYRVNIHITP